MSRPERPEDLMGQPLPDLTLTASDGSPFPLRRHVGTNPLVLFFLIHLGTPGWVRELREFRAHHDALSDAGLVVAGVTRNSIRDSATWVKRLGLPYSVLTDVEGEAGRAFGIVRSVGIGTWKIEFFRRSTFLADLHGTVSAVWRDVKVRGHAQEILAVARALPRVQP